MDKDIVEIASHFCEVSAWSIGNIKPSLSYTPKDAECISILLECAVLRSADISDQDKTAKLDALKIKLADNYAGIFIDFHASAEGASIIQKRYRNDPEIVKKLETVGANNLAKLIV